MSFDQLPTEMKGINSEMRQASLSQPVVDSRRRYMGSLVEDWNSNTDVANVMYNLGKKGNANDVEYYLANSKGFQSYLESFIPWDDLTISAMKNGNLELVRWIVENDKLKDVENKAKYEADEYVITQLSHVWQYAVEEGIEEALDILADGSYPSDILDILVLNEIPYHIEKKIFAKLNPDDQTNYIRLLILHDSIDNALELYKLYPEKEQLRKYLDREFTPNNPMYMWFLEHV